MRQPAPVVTLLRPVVVCLFTLVVGGCSGSTPAAPTAVASAQATAADATPGPGTAAPGAWHGTIAFHAVVNVLKDGPSPDDPSVSLHEETRVDVTDTFEVGGADPSDVADFGTSLVKLTGSAANQGSTVERYVYTSVKTNALGCQYRDETGTDVRGTWTLHANAAGEIRFADDGTYTITMNAGGDPVTGESVPDPKLPKDMWETFTILAGAAGDCPTALGHQAATEGPVISWASSLQGAYTSIGAKFAAGSVVDGSTTFTSDVLGAAVTVTWHLVHDGPIVLPHS